MNPARRLTRYEWARATKLRRLGWSWATIAPQFRMGTYALRRQVDPEFRKKGGVKLYQPSPEAATGNFIPRVDRIARHEPRNPVYDPSRDGERRHDSLTAALMGDPPVGQRALDQMPRDGAEKPAHALFGPTRVSAAFSRADAPVGAIFVSGGNRP